MNRLFRILTPFIALAGAVIFLMLGIRSVRARQTYLKTTGSITDIRVTYGASDHDNEYLVLVRYEVDGTAYTSPLGEYSSSMRIGQSIDILYNPENPAEITSAGLMGPILTFGMCGLCILVCVGSAVKRLRGDAV